MRAAQPTLVLLLTVSALLAACRGDDNCDPGQREQDYSCVPEDAGSAGSSGGSDVAPGDFGSECAADGECAAPADYCVKSPGAAKGTCSASGCDQDGSLCPAGWRCNTTYMVYGAPAFCSQ